MTCIQSLRIFSLYGVSFPLSGIDGDGSTGTGCWAPRTAASGAQDRKITREEREFRMTDTERAGKPRSGGVQSVDRAIDLLELLADAGGESTLSELAAKTSLPLPTIHRLMRTLLSHGYVRQLPSRRYALGPRLIRLGESAGRQLGSDARPYLAALAQDLGESANLAMIDRDMVVYVAQASSAHSMRMFTEVGRRVFPHSAGVGKAVLSQLPDQTVMEIVSRVGMPAATDRTIVSPSALLAELSVIRERGFAIDDGEQEIGVRCFAVP